MEVMVERYVEQVVHGSEYKGYLKIGATQLDYQLTFTSTIDGLEHVEKPNGSGDIRRLFQLSVARVGQDIELSDAEYGFFFQMLVEFAMNFYYNPQTQDNNEGLVGQLVRGEPLFGLHMGSAKIGMSSNGICGFPRELCELLSQPKFGCALV